MPRGMVKWFDGEKDYDFVSPDEGGEDVFVHHTSIAGSRSIPSTKAKRSPTR